MTDTPDGWSLQDEDCGMLGRLCDALRNLTTLGRSGQDFIAIGEAIDAIECLLNGKPIDVNVSVDIGFRRGNEVLEEGLFICFHIDDEEVRLSELRTTYSSAVGSDHSSITYAALTPDNHFDEVGANEWLDQLDEVRHFGDVTLNVERNHA